MMTATPPPWVAEFIGIPFQRNGIDRNGVDCWGLVRLIYAERFKVELPRYAYDDFKCSTISPIIRSAAKASWQAIEHAHDERPGDVVVFKAQGQPAHLGLIVARNIMIHAAMRTKTARIDHFRGHGIWSKRPIEAIYRRIEST